MSKREGNIPVAELGLFGIKHTFFGNEKGNDFISERLLPNNTVYKLHTLALIDMYLSIDINDSKILNQKQ